LVSKDANLIIYEIYVRFQERLKRCSFNIIKMKEPDKHIVQTLVDRPEQVDISAVDGKQSTIRNKEGRAKYASY
jgi:hypothetical protein